MELTNDFSVPVPVSRAWEVLNDVELIAPCLPGAQLQEIEGNEYRGTVKVKVGPITAQYKGAAVFTEQDEANRKIVIDASGRDTRGQGSASAIITVTMSEADGRTDVTVHSDVTIKGKVAQFGRGMISDVSAKILTQFVECLEGKLEAEPSAADDDSEWAAPDGSAAAATAPSAGATSASPDDSTTATDRAPAAGDATSATDGADSGAAVSAPDSGASGAAPAGDSLKTEPEPAPPKVRKIDAPEAEPVDLLGTAGAPVAQRVVPVVVAFVVLILLGRRRSKRRSA